MVERPRVARTYKILQYLYYQPKTIDSMHQYIRNCHTCLIVKLARNKLAELLSLLINFTTKKILCYEFFHRAAHILRRLLSTFTAYLNYYLPADQREVLFVLSKFFYLLFNQNVYTICIQNSWTSFFHCFKLWHTVYQQVLKSLMPAFGDYSQVINCLLSRN